MPNIGSYHPVIVHFAIVLLIVGAIFRWVSLSGRAAFTGPAAATLLLAGAVAAALAVHSGLDAHGPVERIPGARQAVGDHEEAGEWARNVFLVVAALELAALIARRRNLNVARGALWGSALVCVFGVAALAKAADRGGDLVYNYAGGVGIRSGDTADVTPACIRPPSRPAPSMTARARRSCSASWNGNSPTTRPYGCSRSSRSCAISTTAGRRWQRCPASGWRSMIGGCSFAWAS